MFYSALHYGTFFEGCASAAGVCSQAPGTAVLWTHYLLKQRMILERLNALLRLAVFVLMVHSSVLAFRRSIGTRTCRQLRSPFRQVSPMHRMFSAHPKPDFSKESKEKYFDFNRLERDIYNWWEVQGMFKPDAVTAASAVLGAKNPSKKPFVIPMPPPNVTGYLHMGHAIFIALQDIMARFQRMRGRPTLWLPGT